MPEAEHQYGVVKVERNKASRHAEGKKYRDGVHSRLVNSSTTNIPKKRKGASMVAHCPLHHLCKIHAGRMSIYAFREFLLGRSEFRVSVPTGFGVASNDSTLDSDDFIPPV